MNETRRFIRLRDLLDNDSPWGRDAGHQTHRLLLDAVRDLPDGSVVQISVAGIRRTDASFPRESVAELARKYRGTIGISVVDLAEEDLIDNWDAGAVRINQPLTIWDGNKWRFLGPEPNAGLKSVLDHVMSASSVVATEIATTEQLNLANASNKLKQLWQEGYILRRPRAASTGGTEYEYYPIK